MHCFPTQRAIAFIALLGAVPRTAAAQDSTATNTPAADSARNAQAEVAQKYVLDYDVPESPALIAIGAAPANVIRGSAAKPVVAHLVNQFQAGSKVDNGIAIDFSPYFVFGGRLESIVEYRKNAIKRILANTQLSFATAQSSVDTTSLVFGVGVRATLFDKHDLLADPTLGRDIDDALKEAASSAGAELTTDDEITKVKAADLTKVYDDARKRVRNQPGGALTIGWGMSGLLRGSIADGDSVNNTRHRLWVSYRHSFKGGVDLLSTAQWAETDSGGAISKAGVALRSNGPAYNFAAEVFFDSDPGKVASGRFGIGANGELRVTRGVGLVASLATEPIVNGGRTLSKLRVRTSIRWNMSSEP